MVSSSLMKYYYTIDQTNKYYGAFTDITDITWGRREDTDKPGDLLDRNWSVVNFNINVFNLNDFIRLMPHFVLPQFFLCIWFINIRISEFLYIRKNYKCEP